jgi:para-aminobenzoate synthetase component 1
MYKKIILSKIDLWDLYKKNEWDQPSFILHSSGYDAELGRYSIVGWDPYSMLRSRGNIVEHFENDEWLVSNMNPLEALEELCNDINTSMINLPDLDLPFFGGLVGYISYDMKNNIEKLTRKCDDDLGIYEQYWGVYDCFIIQDHLKDLIYLLGHNKERFDKMTKEFFELLSASDKERSKITTKNFRSNYTKEDYLESILKVKDHIRKGNVYQVNLSQRFAFEMDGNPLDFYDILRKLNPASFGGVLNFAEMSILSISPERYIKIDGRGIETRPIKGTRKRGMSIEEDELLKNELRESCKDQAELLMIVDLERNDLGRICIPGSIKVENIFAVKEHATLFHLDAVVKGILKNQITIADVLKHTFPGGSITGAPKIMAMNIIESLEPTARGIYTGSIGYIDCRGNCDLNIAIRTLVIKDHTAYYQAGGGLVSDSDPELEYEETMTKSRALFMALEEVNS